MVDATAHGPPADGMRVFWIRALAIGSATVTTAFLLDSFLTLGQGWPGSRAAFGADASMLAWLQAAIYLAALAAALVWARHAVGTPLRADAERLTAVARFVVRVAFWCVLIVGVADMIISFLRVEDLLPGLIGAELTSRIGVPNWRGHYIHVPLMVLAVLIAIRHRGFGFTWLAALVVVAEFIIVLARFIFSYEQAFMGDLVRFWYAALFLFASAQTLVEEGHVRVDVAYAGFSPRTKARTNFYGAVLLGIPLCWTILALGLRNKAAIIASPILSFETTQSGFGLYVKYMMAGFLGVFAFSMLIQFAASFLSAAADLRDEPGGQPPDDHLPGH